MKANEAPEKIYVHVRANKELSTAWYDRRIGVNNIEYIRTDIFIKKIYDWLKNYAFVDEAENVHLPTLLHDFLKDSRSF